MDGSLMQGPAIGSWPKIASVSETLATQRSIRAFLDRQVEESQVHDILRRAARAPSGGNLQPWIVHTISGERLDRLKALMRHRCASAPEGELGAPDFYPKMPGPHHVTRRVRNGDILYGALGIGREDKAARMAWIHENFQFFGAPFGIFLFLENNSGPYQWLDLGIYLQSVLLLLAEAGYGACPQADWAVFPDTLAAFLQTPPDLTLICGIAVGHADMTRPENRIRTERDDPLTTFTLNPTGETE
jgi:nitroreductase